MLLSGKRVLVMGLLDHRSFALDIGMAAEAAGAEVIYSSQRPTLSRGLLRRNKIPHREDQILPCEDVRNDEDLRHLFEAVGAPLHGVVHSIAYANPATCLQGKMTDAPVEDVLASYHISVVSLASVTRQAAPLMTEGGSVIVLSFDSAHSYPNYNWMGVNKAALEALARALQRDYGRAGVRVNTISAGPQMTMAAASIPGFQQIASEFPDKAPLGWDIENDGASVGSVAVFLLSDLAKKVGGQVIYVDGGGSAMGTPLLEG
jgi:enoyl-[acyl-carrier protein] reductase I